MKHFNTRLGTQTIGGGYKFTKDNSLLETAKGMYEMGSDILKFNLSYAAYFDIKEQVERENKVGEYLSYVQTAQSEIFRQVLDMPFKYYMMWVHPKFTDAEMGIDFEIDNEVESKIYNEIYELTKHLLTTYSGTGKVFTIGNWEGDWILLQGYDFDKEPNPQVIEGLIKNFKIRQQAIEDARNSVKHEKVWVGHYIEVNRALDAKDFGLSRITNKVLPHVTVDMVSYSAYEATFPIRVTEALEYIKSQARFTSYFDVMFEEKVYIGEYDCYNDYHVHGYVEELIQTKNTLNMMTAAMSWGVPFVLYWEYYNNDRDNLKPGHGFWLVDENNKKTVNYYLHQNLLGKISAANYIYRMIYGEILPLSVLRRLLLKINEMSLVQIFDRVLNYAPKGIDHSNFIKRLNQHLGCLQQLEITRVVSIGEIIKQMDNQYYEIWRKDVDAQEFFCELLVNRNKLNDENCNLIKLFFRRK